MLRSAEVWWTRSRAVDHRFIGEQMGTNSGGGTSSKRWYLFGTVGPSELLVRLAPNMAARCQRESGSGCTPITNRLRGAVAWTVLLRIAACPAIFLSGGASAHADERAPPPSYSYASPFHPSQCHAAIDAGCKALSRDPSSRRSLMIVAEGLLCAGLQEDLWALDAAIALLDRIVAEEPSNLFARLDLADALRLRYPLSDAAYDALAMVDARLDQADVGAARDGLRQYVRQNLGGLDAARSIVSYSSGASHESASMGPQPLSLAALAIGTALALTGPSRVAELQSALDAHLRQVPGDPLASFLKAELSLGRVPRETARDLYQQAKMRLCINARYKTQCDLAKRRIGQIASPAAECPVPTEEGRGREQ